MDQEGKSLIDPNDANYFRTFAGSALIMDLLSAVIQEPFDAHWVSQAMARLEQAWAQRFGSAEGCFSTPWNGRLSDCGQAGNAYVKREHAHPLVSACRWGSAESIEWLCAHPDMDPVVSFVDAARFWSFSRAGISGISGAFGPLWAKAKASGWSQGELGEAVSSWLMGVQDGPLNSLAASLDAARPALAELIDADPSWTVPLASSSTFGTGLSAAICGDDRDGRPGKVAFIQAMIQLLPAERWVHETLLEGSDLWEERMANPGSPSDPSGFIEDAVSIGNFAAAELLAKAGFEMPSLEAAIRARGGVGAGLSDSASQRAFEVVSRHWCDVERSRIERDCLPAPTAGPRFL